jgi:hypothetical protein
MFVYHTSLMDSDTSANAATLESGSVPSTPYRHLEQSKHRFGEH